MSRPEEKNPKRAGPNGGRSAEGSITDLLHRWGRGSEAAVGELMPLVAEELRVLARSHFRREGRGHTLQPTALVNEVYLRFVRQARVRLENRVQFFAFASRLMRRILVDHHRARASQKRGAGHALVTVDEALDAAVGRDLDLLVLDDALEALRSLDERQCRIVEQRFFGGLTVREIAQVERVSPTTVKREWATAKAWLRHELRA